MLSRSRRPQIRRRHGQRRHGGFVQRADDPRHRFPDADAADLDKMGAVSFHRQLVKTNLSTEYDRELAWWLDLLGEDLGEWRVAGDAA